MQLKPVVLKKGFYATLFLIGIATFAVHEFFHWFAGTVLGYDMVITPNRVYSKTSTEFIDKQIISFAGPFITYVQAVIGYLWVVKKQSMLGFSLLYMAFFMRLFAAGISVFNPNDEARISQALGIGLWTLPVIVVSVLFVLLYLASRRLKLTARDHLFCYLVASIVVTLVVGVDSFFFA
ncbi:MAG: hypothetical protein KTR29_05385 [Rhodothermaceae bacterium]|nr:hypothetical protein [Rhodothermaceae bacterium]